MTAGIWFYMTPQDPKPSMHDVMTGFFEPTSADMAANIGADFGTTTNIINGAMECGFASDKAESRGIYFNKWLEFFGLPTEGNVGCADQMGGFPSGGAGNVPGHWEQGWSGQVECRPVGYQTPYAMSARDDYKRCVCDRFGSGESDCPQADGEVPDPTPGPNPDDGDNNTNPDDGDNNTNPDDGDNNTNPDDGDNTNPDDGNNTNPDDNTNPYTTW